MKSPINRGGLRFYLVIFALAATVVAGYATPKSILAGAPLVILGAALHIWAKGCLHQNLEVTRVGPYRYVRHPFYTANALVDAGVAVMSGWWALWIALPIWWLAVYIPVIRGEEAFLAGQFPADYAEYKKRIWMLIPLGRPLAKQSEEFSWQNRNIASGKELPRALRILAYPLLFYAASELRAFGLETFTQDHPYQLLALSALATMYGAAWELEQHLKRGAQILPDFMQRIEARAIAAAAIIATAAGVSYQETELGNTAIALSSAALGLSTFLFLTWRQAALSAECIALAAFAVLCELVWLAPLPVLLYAALALDARHRRSAALAGNAAEAGAADVQPSLYYVIFVVGMAASIVKEVLLD